MGSASDQGGCGWVEVTREMMAKASITGNCHGYTRGQLFVLSEVGVDPYSHGWLKWIIGKQIDRKVWNWFVEAGNRRRHDPYSINEHWIS